MVNIREASPIHYQLFRGLATSEFLEGHFFSRMDLDFVTSAQTVGDMLLSYPLQQYLKREAS
jgi:hypothetical protein